MKKILFILLVFTSFQGFSQYATTVKIKKAKELGIEFIVIDFQLDWYLANMWIAGYNESFENNPWRLPTSYELRKIFDSSYSGNFKNGGVYWSSEEVALDYARTVTFSGGNICLLSSKKKNFHFCLFRTLY